MCATRLVEETYLALTTTVRELNVPPYWIELDYGSLRMLSHSCSAEQLNHRPENRSTLNKDTFGQCVGFVFRVFNIVTMTQDT